MDSRFQLLDSKSFSVELGFRIPIVSSIPDSLSCIPDSKAQDSGFHKHKCQRFRNPDSLTWGDRVQEKIQPRSQGSLRRELELGIQNLSLKLFKFARLRMQFWCYRCLIRQQKVTPTPLLPFLVWLRRRTLKTRTWLLPFATIISPSFPIPQGTYFSWNDRTCRRR